MPTPRSTPRRSSLRYPAQLVALVAVLAGVVPACGSDSEGGGTGAAGSSSGGAGGATAGAGGATAGNGAGGAKAGGPGGTTCTSSSSEGDGCAAAVAGCVPDGTWNVALTTPCQPPIASAAPPTQVTFTTAGGKTCATTSASGVKLELGADCVAKLSWSDKSASAMANQCFSCSTYRDLTLTIASDGSATGSWAWKQLGECGGNCTGALTVTKK